MAMYDRQAATALRLIAKYGVEVPLTVRSYIKDPDKPWKDAELVESVKPVRMVFLPLTKVGYESLTKVANTEVPTGAVMAYMGEVSFEFALDATVFHDGKNYAIHYLDVLAPNGRKILYTMVLGL